MPEYAEHFQQILDALLRAYGEYCEIERDYDVDGEAVAATAQVRVEEKRPLVLTIGKGRGQVNLARQLTLFLVEEQLDAARAERILGLLRKFEQQMQPVEEEHVYTMYDMVVLTDKPAAADVAKMLKRFRLRPEYQYGWGRGRVAVVDVNTQAVAVSKDAKELGQIVLQRMQG